MMTQSWRRGGRWRRRDNSVGMGNCNENYRGRGVKTHTRLGGCLQGAVAFSCYTTEGKKHKLHVIYHVVLCFYHHLLPVWEFILNTGSTSILVFLSIYWNTPSVSLFCHEHSFHHTIQSFRASPTPKVNEIIQAAIQSSFTDKWVVELSLTQLSVVL